MAKFSAYNSNSTPVVNTSYNNLNLMGSAALRATVQEVSWGGGASSSTPMETACVRTSTAGTAAPPTANVQRLDQTLTSAGNTAGCYANASWTAGPTRVAGALFGAAWNAYGGVVRWLAAPGEEWDLALTTNGIVMAQIVGVGTSTYGLVWTEF
jgi:hypothetical protein